ncbi:AB hydrolase-1 domain-containing protein [Favolaschia claudopus]|uniref:AB hydrolase-1 domain-containing protein n=1 Tax=Favolaschia claudopus TaxID=2862362 RepID=A0AAW0ALR1_9AGAR
MPSITLETPTGVVDFNYVISTPTETSAACIDPTLPTILFLHPVYLGKIIYHPQFSDRELRRFNLIGMDLRCHARTIGRAGEGYGREVAARDVALFMSSLQIPRYHLFGMSMGGCIALQTAILFPSNVLSIFVVSSLPLTEPIDVGEGRQEIYDYWAEGVSRGEKLEPGSMMGDAITGCLQLSVNGQASEAFQAIVRVSSAFMTSQWGVNALDDFRVASVDFFVKREAYTLEAMRNIACPVFMVHCGADVAYDISTTNQVADHLRTAGVKVEVVQIPDAPHFGATTHAKEINEFLSKFILSLCEGPPPPIPQQVVSPFKDQLVAVGWDSDESDEEEFFI